MPLFNRKISARSKIKSISSTQGGNLHANPVKQKGVSRNEYFFLAVVVVLCLFHLLRNISIGFSIGYIFLATILFIFTVFNGRRLLPGLWIILLYAYIFLISLVNASIYGDILIGIARLAYFFPLAVYFYRTDLSEKQIYGIWKIYFIFVLACAASILIQYGTGHQISWFSEPSSRVGLIRYSSLAGSLTVFGGIVGSGIYLCFFIIKKIHIRWIVIVFFSLAAVLSLQKASLIGALLGIFLSQICRGETRSYFAIFKFGLALLLSGTIVFLLLIMMLPEAWLSSLELFFTGAFGGEGSDDYSIKDSVALRFADLPLGAIDYFGWSSLFFGVGVYGAAGGLGYPEIPMAHNQIVEIFIVAGLLGGITFLLFCGFALKASVKIIFFKSLDNTRWKISAGVFSTIFLVGLNTGTIFYQPVIAVAFWLSLSELMRYNRLNKVCYTS